MDILFIRRHFMLNLHSCQPGWLDSGACMSGQPEFSSEGQHNTPFPPVGTIVEVVEFNGWLTPATITFRWTRGDGPSAVFVLRVEEAYLEAHPTPPAISHESSDVGVRRSLRECIADICLWWY